MKLSTQVCMVAPYVVWMALMTILPATAWAYAVRSGATLATLLAAFAACRRIRDGRDARDIWRPCRANAQASQSTEAAAKRKSQIANPILAGIVAGIVVWALWVLPENLPIYKEWFILGADPAASSAAGASALSPYAPAVCGWPLTLVRLLGSAFVIPAVEEIFFRGWLYRWLGADKAAFFWMVVLFAIEHDRFLVGALAGAAYGLLALRTGLFSAIVAHTVTNLILGIQVIILGHWDFW